MNHLIAGGLAAIWGTTWAYCLESTWWGQYLAARKTWVTVVIGVGVDLLICKIVLKPEDASKVNHIFAISSLALIARGIYYEIPLNVRNGKS